MSTNLTLPYCFCYCCSLLQWMIRITSNAFPPPHTHTHTREWRRRGAVAPQLAGSKSQQLRSEVPNEWGGEDITKDLDVEVRNHHHHHHLYNMCVDAYNGKQPDAQMKQTRNADNPLTYFWWEWGRFTFMVASVTSCCPQRVHVCFQQRVRWQHKQILD